MIEATCDLCGAPLANTLPSIGKDLATARSISPDCKLVCHPCTDELLQKLKVRRSHG